MSESHTISFFFFFNDTATTEIYTLSLHDALPISIDPVLVADQVAWSFTPREGLGNLLRDPFGRRVRCYVDPDKLSTDQPDDDQNIEQVKADGRNHEQVHGRDVRRVVAQEGAPALSGRVRSFGHILGDGRLSDRKAELEQLTMNVRRTPKHILHAHPSDQRPQIRIDLRPASQGTRFPAPIAAKAGTMPAHKRLGPDDDHGLED